jgi:hypothetical protein
LEQRKFNTRGAFAAHSVEFRTPARRFASLLH